MTREQELEKIIIDTIWMSRRYADGRRTYAVSMVNDAIDKCKELGIEIKKDDTLLSGNEYASDGDLDSMKVTEGSFLGDLTPEQSYEVQTAIMERIAYFNHLEVQMRISNDLFHEDYKWFNDTIKDLKTAKEIINERWPIRSTDR